MCNGYLLLAPPICDTQIQIFRIKLNLPYRDTKLDYCLMN